jgi:hypothetical protein
MDSTVITAEEAKSIEELENRLDHIEDRLDKTSKLLDKVLEVLYGSKTKVY